MNGLTHKEKADLEQVFAAIYVKKQSKFIRFYKEIYLLGKNRLATKIKSKISKIRICRHS
ncbi:hypothetical protein [Campylobacter sp. 19-13652]|uniref:hypothetical protein n=1 Tax=Campylobacter sp. 19-13652 TaxID=2840180 RepID=UPI001C784D21|nr:hypothetical protein [Campylobacter sp. 19-13652]BCX79148.1 hypothetical protein LBC_06100 [Campylobacter sp. 19-13652]